MQATQGFTSRQRIPIATTKQDEYSQDTSMQSNQQHKREDIVRLDCTRSLKCQTLAARLGTARESGATPIRPAIDTTSSLHCSLYSLNSDLCTMMLSLFSLYLRMRSCNFAAHAEPVTPAWPVAAIFAATASKQSSLSPSS